MIVICPSCGTPYRHALEADSLQRSARCSRCSCTFPMPAGRAYRIEAAAPVAPEERREDAVVTAPPVRDAEAERPVERLRGAMTIGMDDPTLAQSLERTALTHDAGAPRAAMTYWVLADEAAPADAPSDVALPAPRESTGSEPAAVEPSETAYEPVPRRGRRPGAPRPFVALAGGGGVGTVWGAAIAAVAGQPLWQGAALGGALGLAVAGGVLRWNVRKP